MYRNTNVNHASEAPTTNRSMFARPLSASSAAPAQTFVSVRRHWHQHQPRISWWSGQLPQQSWCPRTTFRAHSASHRPRDPFRWHEWRRPGVFPFSDPRSGLHVSSGLMDRSDKESPLKKRKSTEDGDSGRSWPRSPKRSSLRQGQEQSPEWLHNVTGTRISPGKFPSKPENRVTETELTRKWEEVCGLTRQEHGSSHGQHFDFSVMSYNILSQELLLSNAYLYKHCNPLVLPWRHRFTNIIKELEQHNADIMCLQEVQEDHYVKQIKPSLESLGYHCEYKRRTGRKPDGCAVAFKRKRFSLLSCHPVEYFRRGIPLLDRDNVGLVLLLQPVEQSASARSICVANTHLLYNPRRGDIKLAQLAMLLAEVRRVVERAPGAPCPVLLCGDFNSLPRSPLCSFIKESRLEYAGMPIGKVSGQEDSPRGQRVLTPPIWPGSLGISRQCQYESQAEAASTNPAVKDLPQRAADALNGGDGSDVCSSADSGTPRLEHGLKLSSVYSHYLRESSRPEITTCHSRTAITVDYIFYSSGSECSDPDGRGLQLMSRLALVSEAELKEVNLLPNLHHSSDHLPLVARFRLHP